MRTMTAALCAMAAALTGCNPDPAENAAPAQVSDAVEAPAPAPADAEAEAEAMPETPAEAPPGELATGEEATVYAVDKAQSVLTFTGSKVTANHSGGWTEYTGTITVPGGNFTAAKIRVDIDMNSTYSDDVDLTEKLKSDWFFDVANHPAAAFESTGIVKNDAGDAGYDISGNLTLRGVTKNLTFPATVTMENDTLTAEAEFSFDRKLFGVAYDGLADDVIRDNVLMALYIVAPAS